MDFLSAAISGVLVMVVFVLPGRHPNWFLCTNLRANYTIAMKFGKHIHLIDILEFASQIFLNLI